MEAWRQPHVDDCFLADTVEAPPDKRACQGEQRDIQTFLNKVFLSVTQGSSSGFPGWVFRWCTQHLLWLQTPQYV